MKKYVFVLLAFLMVQGAFAQSNSAISMSENLAYTVRFNPYDKRQIEILKTLKPSFLIKNLRTDEHKNAFWLNIYNSMMLIHLRDTLNEGMYSNFYKTKNITIAGKSFSLFEIEHEFLFKGLKMKKLKFKKSKLDTTWIKLRPDNIDPRVIFCMYRGLYGYPPFQIVENGELAAAYKVGKTYCTSTVNGEMFFMDWIKNYKVIKPGSILSFITTPEAVFINNYFPKYEGVKFKEEKKNPWLK